MHEGDGGADLNEATETELSRLRHEIACFEALVQGLPDLYFSLADDGTILDYRAKSDAELYVPPEVFLGRRMWDVLPPDTVAIVREAVERVRREGTQASVEYSLPMPSGAARFEARVAAATAGRTAVLVRNVTSEWAAADQHRRTLSRLRATLDATADGILVVDRAGRIEDFNERFVQLWGIPAALLESRDDARVLAYVLDQLAEPEAFLARVRALYDEPEAESLDVLSFRDGRRVERYSRPQRRDGEYVGRVWSFRDVTKQHEAEAAREQALADAREAVRAREEFLSIASHELRTPLTALMLALGALPRLCITGDVPARAGQAIEIALRQGRVLSRLVDELLSVSRIQSGKLALRRDTVELVEVATEALSIVGEELRRAGCAVTLEAPAPVRGSWDRARLLQVVVNLLANAARHAPGASVSLRVCSHDGRARLEVQDTGPGIAPDMRERIFQRFERAEPATDEGGLGLGLYIARQIARAHGGELWLASGAVAGAAFIVELPP